MTAENRSRDGGNVWMIVLIALALIATVIMLFSNSAVWLQVALLAALWAAICGFLLVSRTRNDRDRLRAEAESREREYQAELEALRARSDADRYALEAARAGEGLPPAVDVEVLREIRAELATLRAQLEDLSGREFGYEPAALQAEARRVKEIEARASRVAPAAESDPRQQQEQFAPRPTQQPQPQQQTHVQPAPKPKPQPQPQAQQPQPQAAAHPRPEPVAQQNPFEKQTQPQPQQEQPAQRATSTRWDATNATEETSRIAPVRDEDENQAINALTKQPQQPTPQQESAPKPQRPEAHPTPQQQQPEEPQARPASEGTTRVHRAPSSEAVAGRVGSHRAPEGRNPLTELIRERQEELERERAERERQQREAQERRQREERERAERERRQREEQAQRAREEEARRVEEARRAEAVEQEQESRGRRRADENRDGALSVAELLARSKKGQ